MSITLTGSACLIALLSGCLVETESTRGNSNLDGEHPGISFVTEIPGRDVPSATDRSQPSPPPPGYAEEVSCTTATFEGVGSLQPVGVVTGTPNVSFGSSWLGLLDADEGGTGNIANEPSPSTAAFFLDQSDISIQLDAGAQFIEFFYSASSVSLPLTVTAFDIDGNIIDQATGNTSGSIFDGADCMGDPTGVFCLWDTITLISATNNIRSISIAGTAANQFGIDDLTICTGIPQPANDPPVADAGADQDIECSGPDGSGVALDASASADPDGTIMSFEWFDSDGNPVGTGAQPVVSLPLGTHVLTLRVTDDLDATAEDEVVVTVADTTAPTILLSPSPAVLWPPNHKLRDIDFDVAIEDACDANLVVTGFVVSNEADDAHGKGDGKTCGDIRVTTGDGDLLKSSNDEPEVPFDPRVDALALRAERDGKGSGRVYTITVEAEDASGHISTATTEVVVEHDQCGH
ncbi:PKD domain-containing protein [Haliangium sp.]|uniref:PKD domain-containing protein n=1 Tax=Haliangium sp. TaxID=2663208 RepID=UPI003D0B6359